MHPDLSMKPPSTIPAVIPSAASRASTAATQIAIKWMGVMDLGHKSKVKLQSHHRCSHLSSIINSCSFSVGYETTSNRYAGIISGASVGKQCMLKEVDM
jgi:hypothetical protein